MSQIEKLLTVQDHDIRISRIEKELKDIPVRQKAEEIRLAEHKKALEAADGAMKLKMAALKDQENNAESLKQNITKLRQQQMELKTNKEFKAVESEVSTLQGKISALEDTELGLMEEIDSARKIVTEKMKALKEEEAHLGVDVKALDGRALELKAELEKEKAIRAQVATTVAREWLTAYDRLCKRKEPALVPLEDGVCGGCHLKLAPSVAHNAKKRLAVVTCDFCGRMLY